MRPFRQNFIHAMKRRKICRIMLAFTKDPTAAKKHFRQIVLLSQSDHQYYIVIVQKKRILSIVATHVNEHGCIWKGL